MHIENDKYYTNEQVAKKLIDKTFETLKDEHITEIIEPSAGNGAFSKQINGCIAYDIAPEDVSVIKQDFFTLDLQYKAGRLFIGNPPFGTHNTLIGNFYKKCVELGDYIAFILPIGQLNNTITLYEFDLVHSEDLGIQEYSGRKLHCCFNIYKRPISGLNKKPNYKLNDVVIIEHRRKKGVYSTGRNKDIPPNYDYAMCNWGNGCLGKVPDFIGQYAQEVYIYVKNKQYLTQILQLLEFNKIRDYANSISAKKNKCNAFI